jgi:hypothetical protein
MIQSFTTGIPSKYGFSHGKLDLGVNIKAVLHSLIPVPFHNVSFAFQCWLSVHLLFSFSTKKIFNKQFFL